MCFKLLPPLQSPKALGKREERKRGFGSIVYIDHAERFISKYFGNFKNLVVTLPSQSPSGKAFSGTRFATLLLRNRSRVPQ